MNRMATKHLNIMRIEILLSIGLVLWIVSIETKSQELIEFNNGEVANAKDINANFQSLNAQIAEKSEKINLYSEGDFEGELMTELDPFRGDDFQGSDFKTPGDYLLPLAVRFDNAFTTRRAGQDKIWFTEPLCAGEAYIRTPFFIPKSAAYQGILDHDPTFGWYMAPFSNYVSEGITALS